jgi:cytochrome c5
MQSGILVFVTAALLSGITGMADAQDKSGETIYAEVCAECHGKGLNGAPKFGDRTAWAKLIKEGQVAVTADGYVGVRLMPPKGGRPDLSVEEFARAVTHMARTGGATWKDADVKTMEAIKARIAKRQAANDRKK